MEQKVFKIRERAFTAGPEDELVRLDRVIFRRNVLPSMNLARALIERGGVILNDRVVNFPSKKVKEGDKIFVRRAIFLSFKKGKNLPHVIYEDESIVVINKPSGVLSPEEGSNSTGKFLKDFKGNIFPVHRLDKETSGVMVFAKTRDAEEFLKMEFKEKRVKKTYLAVLNGILIEDSGVIKGIMKATGEYGESEFIVKERHRLTTLVEVYPKTGRTNQIRIQFSEMGYPLVGEYKYLSTSKKECVIFPRLALHAFSISFHHPDSSKVLTFTANLPSEFLVLLQFLRKEDMD